VGRVCSIVVMFFSNSAAIWMPGVVRLGGMRLSVFGLCAALGLVAAFFVMRWTAPLAGVDRDGVVDAGMLGLTVAFVASRVLLVAENWHVFRLYPMLVLEVPSLTYGAMAVVAVTVTVYLQWKRLSMLRVLDAWAPAAAVIAIALSIGHWFEGSDAGMPTRMPWGVPDAVLGKVQPVQWFAEAAALVVLVWMLRVLLRKHEPGQVAGAGLIPGGVAVYSIALMMQPEPSVLGLEARQWLALVAIGLGAWMSLRWMWDTPMKDEREKELS
jgi:phosphatidylglycerol:prolipoprotein diacylglycerol transferase